MNKTAVQSEYGFRSRAYQSYNPDNDVAQTNKRKRRITKTKTFKLSKISKYAQIDMNLDCDSSEDKHTVITLSTTKSGDF